MALPTSRDTTYAPGSQVESADLNDIQDQIIANNTRLNNGAGAQVVLAIAPLAPYWGVSGAGELEMIPPTSGNAGHGGQAADFDCSTGVVIGGSSVFDWVVPVPMTFGQVVRINADFEMTVAVSGGSLNLMRVNGSTGAATVAATIAIPSATGRQSLTVVSGFSPPFGYYSLQFNFAGGHGGVKIYGVEKVWTRP